MDNLELIKSLSMKNDKKVVMLVIDGLGGAPYFGKDKTELEVANIPNFDEIARNSLCGLSIPVDYGITPGSGPGHLALFGYDPIKYLIGRGVLEVLGLGMNMTNKDVAFRGNFATIRNNIVVDRRAGRIPTEKTVELISKISEKIKNISGIDILLTAGKGHRFAGILRGDGLSDLITENDPHKEGNAPHKVSAINPEDKKSIFTAEVVEKLINGIRDVLAKEKEANYVLLRGFSKYPNIPKMQEVFKFTPVAIAVYPMYKGLAQLVGMEVISCSSLQDEVNKLKELYNKPYDFYYVHFKDTDALGEDGIIKYASVYNPYSKEFFFAKKGCGATKNDRVIKVSKTTSLSNSLLVTGFPYYTYKNPKDVFDLFQKFSLKSQAVRRLGSAALDMCYVAEGIFDGFWEENLEVWDVAAASLIVEEAGGKVTDFFGKDDYLFGRTIIATNGRLHRQMVDVIKEVQK